MLLNERLYRSITEVAEELDVSKSLLRYWETQFSQLKPIRKSGKRLYTKSDIEVAKKIKSLLHGKGFTIKGAQKYLQDNDKSGELDAVAHTVSYLKSLKCFLERYI